MKTAKMFRKISAILLGALLAAAAVVPAFAAGKTPKGMIVEETENGAAEYQIEHADLLYSIYEKILNHEEEINVMNDEIPVDEYSKLAKSLLSVYPDLFFIEGSLGASSFSWDGTNYYLYKLFPAYNMDKDESDAKLSEFYAKADEYLALVDDSMDEFTKAVVLHEALVQNNRYQVQNSSNYTFMVEGFGRCENYAEVYAYLLANVGIESEIVGSDEMVHEWMRIHLDGSDYYYNVDVTWDDPTINGIDRPDRVSHTYFLLSDELLQDPNYSTERHYSYGSHNAAGNAYDGYANLHSNKNPLYYVDGTFYTLYKKQMEDEYGDDRMRAVIASYDYATDSYTDLYTSTELWHADSEWSTWSGNYTSIAQLDGVLYFNGEYNVYTYDIATGEKATLMENPLNNGNQLYGLYIQGDKLYGFSASSPNENPTAVELKTLERRYKLGDVDGNGKIDVNDATQIQYYLAELKDETELHIEAADFNQDGEIDISDATDIQFFINQ